MMGHHEKLTGGDEEDALTPWHRYLHWRPGEHHRVKAGFSRRVRRQVKQVLRGVNIVG